MYSSNVIFSFSKSKKIPRYCLGFLLEYNIPSKINMIENSFLYAVCIPTTTIPFVFSNSAQAWPTKESF